MPTNITGCDSTSCRVGNAGASIPTFNGQPAVQIVDENNLYAEADVDPNAYDGLRNVLVFSGTYTGNYADIFSVTEENRSDQWAPINILDNSATFQTSGISWAGIMDPNPAMCNFTDAAIKAWLKGRSGAQNLDWRSDTTDFGRALASDDIRPKPLPIYAMKITITPADESYPPEDISVTCDEITDVASPEGSCYFDIPEKFWKGSSGNPKGYFEGDVKIDCNLDPSDILQQGANGKYFFWLDVFGRGETQ